MTNVENILNDFGKYVVQQSRSNLTKKGKKDQGELYNSLDYEVKVSKNSFEFTLFMEDYGEYVDQGVKGKSSSKKAPNSPFKFGSGTGKKGGLTKAIDGWVKRKRFQFRKADGKFMSYDQTAFLTTRSIYQTGLPTTDFFSKPFDNAFKRLPDEIVEAYALDIDDFFNFSKANR